MVTDFEFLGPIGSARRSATILVALIWLFGGLYYTIQVTSALTRSMLKSFLSNASRLLLSVMRGFFICLVSLRNGFSEEDSKFINAHMRRRLLRVLKFMYMWCLKIRQSTHPMRSSWNFRDFRNRLCLSAIPWSMHICGL